MGVGKRQQAIRAMRGQIWSPGRPSVGSIGDSFDNAMAESAIGLYKTELIRRQGPWRNPDQVEFATLEYIDWFNNRRLHGEIGHVPPAEFEEVFYASRVEEQIKA